MALSKDLDIEKMYYSGSVDENGAKDVLSKVTFYRGVYIKIDRLSGSKDKIELIVSYRDTDGSLIKKTAFLFTPSVADGAENFIRQGYQYLKSLPEFAGAVDC